MKKTTLTFGPEAALVTIPVSYEPATQNGDVGFSLVAPVDPTDPENKQAVQLEQVYRNPLTDEVVTRGEARKGFKLSKGNFVLIDEDAVREIAEATELESAELLGFIPKSAIDPARVKDVHYIGGQAPFPITGLAALLKALKQLKKAGVLRWAAGTKQRLGLLTTDNEGVGQILTLHYAADIKAPKDVFKAPTDYEVPPTVLKQVKQLITALAVEPSVLDEAEDEARELKTRLVDKAVEGVPLDAPKPAAPETTIATLEDSIAQALAATA